MPHLPDELLLKIFESMDEWESRKEIDQIDMKLSFYLPRASRRDKYCTLSNVALASKHFRELAEPLLYATYAKNTNIVDFPRPPDPYAYTGGRWERDPYQRSFLATLIKRPDLAKKVTSLELGGSENHWEIKTHSIFPNRPSKEFRRLLLWRFRVRFSPTFKDIIEAALDGSEDAETALMLALTPKVTSLEYHMPVKDTSHPRIQFQVPIMIERALTLDFSKTETIMLHRMKALERLCIKKDPRYCSWGLCSIELDHFAHVHLLPNLKYLELAEFSDSRDDAVIPTTDVGRSSVETLILSRCSMGIPTIQRLIVSCAHLRRFCFEDRCCGRYARAWDTDWQALISTISRHHRHNLVKLDLSCTKVPYDRDDIIPWSLSHLDHTVPGQISLLRSAPLRDCTALEYLTTHFTPLLKASANDLSAFLPPSLQSLTINNCTELVFDHLATLYAGATPGTESLVLRNRFPELYKIDVGRLRDMKTRGDYDFGSVDVGHMIELGVGLKGIFDAAGIEFLLVE